MRRPLLAILVLSTFLFSGCAHALNAKQQASQAHQTVHAALTTLDDYERTVCQPNPAAVNHCQRVPVIIPDAKHQEFSRAMVSAYDLDKKVGLAIIAWKPCLPNTGVNGIPCTPTPIPTDVTSLRATVEQLITIGTSFRTPSPDIQKYIDLARAVLNPLADIEAALRKGGAPLPFMGPAAGLELLQ